MYKKTRAIKIAKFLKSRLIGRDIEITGVSPADAMQKGRVSFLQKKDFSEDYKKEALVIVREGKKISPKSMNSYIKVPNPRLSYARVAEKFFNTEKKRTIASSAKIGRDVVIGKDVAIGENCVIKDSVVIGERTVINHNVVIAANTRIGKGCYIKSGSVIGEKGFGTEFDEMGAVVSIPHLGGVLIGDNVEIGSLCTIARGTMKDTVICDGVKINDQVHIAHNCVIGRNTVITGQVNISGSTVIGEGCWLGPNCMIMNKLRIGKGAKIGIGAVVIKDIEPNKKVMGLDAMALKDLVRVKKRLGLV